MTGGNKGGASLYPLLGVNFVGALGFSIVLPFLVFLVTRWGGNALIYGLMGATYSVFQLVGAPVLGRWSDIHGRRKILLLSQLGTLISWGVFLVAFALPTQPLLTVESGLLGSFVLTLPLAVLFAARALDGLTGGNVSVANAYLADLTREEDRSAGYGKMAVSANLGFILGPTIAGLLGGSPWGELLPVMAALLVSVVATGLIVFGLEDLTPCSAEQDPQQGEALRLLEPDHKPCRAAPVNGGLSTRDIIRIPHVQPLLAIYFLVLAGFNVFYVAFPVFAAVGMEWSLREVGVFFAVLSLLMVVVQGPVLTWVAKRLSERVLVVGGGLALAASFPLFGAGSTGGTYAGAALLALGNGLMWPSLVSVLSKVAGMQHQGAVQGFAGSLGAVASIIGLVLGGLLFERLGSGVFLLSAGGIFVAALVALRLPRATEY